MSEYIACPKCGAIMDVTGKIKVKCLCEWEYKKVLNTRHPKFEAGCDKDKIQVGYTGGK